MKSMKFLTVKIVDNIIFDSKFVKAKKYIIIVTPCVTQD